ncbi:MAG: hypothetical protein US58_C0010G0013 [Candidatus Magasanikbacteria bacterium GW2011_GWA2_37_8]|uniref:histidine kinase n=1 Tax=Candidatus Magasanikbacteria bacterium GW2011_GWA2_37_8 TaxID=1619036 RepID=A0A0G0HFC0_9BACT|nr:MAG: hypothetical protein US58_C0010G0013 [Candidatus Magasanikbacteria bacterium GW2011_GWA2_37_8]
MKLKLKTKLSLVIIGIISFFGILSVLFVYIQTKASLVSEVKQGLGSVSLVQAHGLVSIFQSGGNLVKSIAVDDTIIEYMRVKDKNPVIEEPIMFDSVGGRVEISDKATLRRLTRYNINDQYSAIYLISTNGTTWESTDKTFVGQNYAFRDYFKQAISGNPWVDVSIGVTSQKLGYYFSYPVKSSAGDILGVVVVKMMPDTINKFILSNNIRGNEVLMFTDSDGVIIFSNDESRIYKSLGLLSPEQQSLIREKKRYSGLEIKPLDYGDVQNDLALVYKYKIYEISDEIDKKKEIVNLTKIGDLPFYLVIERGLEELVAPAMRIALLLSLLVFLAAMFAIVAIIFLVNRILRPLDVLENGVQQLGKENFDYKFTISTGDELEELGKSFDNMAVKLKVSYSKLKEQIEKLNRTNHLIVEREKKMIELKKQIKEHKNS